MKELIFIQVVPDNLYFQWQVEVQIVNFRKFNISSQMQILVFYRDNKNIADWNKIVDKYKEVKFYFYNPGKDVLDIGLYIPILRPYTLKRHFALYPELSEKIFFYHDSDIIFNYLPDFDLLMNDDICWESDTSSYLDYSYLQRKEVQGNLPEGEAISILADIGNITPEIIKSYNNKTGGAQTILKGIDSKFWESVEEKCIKIRKAFSWGQKDSINTKYFVSEAEGFQSWCADMWALNFSLWERGIKTDITKDLNFSWGSSTMTDYNKCPIFHNAGVSHPPKEPENLFYKGDWINKSPIGETLTLPSKNMASLRYVEAILAV